MKAILHEALILFEILHVAVLAFAAWYVRNPHSDDAITVPLIWILSSSAVVLAVVWIAILVKITSK